jgi:hypothetical protein
MRRSLARPQPTGPGTLLDGGSRADGLHLVHGLREPGMLAHGLYDEHGVLRAARLRQRRLRARRGREVTASD